MKTVFTVFCIMCEWAGCMCVYMRKCEVQITAIDKIRRGPYENRNDKDRRWGPVQARRGT